MANWNVCIIFILLLSVVISVLITVFTGNLTPGMTTLGSAMRWMLARQPGRDSWKPMTEAIVHLRAHPDVSVYGKLFFGDHIKFQYPTSALLFLDIPQRLTGLAWDKLYRILDILSWFCVPAVGVISYHLFLRRVVQDRSDFPKLIRIILLITFIATTANFYPTNKAYLLGQIQMFITLLVAVSLLAWDTDRKAACGFLLGLCCAIKPQWIVIVLWASLRREWTVVLTFCVTLGGLVLASTLLYGFDNMVEYASVLSFISSHGEGFQANQSMNGLVNRLLFNGNNLEWDPESFAPYNPFVYGATFISAIVLLGPALLYGIGRRPGTLELMLIILSVTIASPIAWEHHYGILFPMFAVATPIAITNSTWGSITSVYVGAAFLLTSQRLELVTNQFAETHFNFVQSYLFFGALMTLALIYHISYRSARLVGDNSRLSTGL